MTEPKSRMTGLRGKAANGFRLYEIDKAEPRFIRKASEILQQRFGFGPIAEPTVGLDHLVTQSTNGEMELLLGWDIWSGFYVMANSPAGDPILDQFGDYVNSILNDPTMNEYRDESRNNNETLDRG